MKPETTAGSAKLTRHPRNDAVAGNALDVTLFARSDLWMARRRLMEAQGRVHLCGPNRVRRRRRVCCNTQRIDVKLPLNEPPRCFDDAFC